ncbi:MAG: hypothetical protein L0Y58_17020 [Verrucomicrobia subdivision 3 bacterium]|nr:hypothetical protein [Limisphaerales bacterium]
MTGNRSETSKFSHLPSPEDGQMMVWLLWSPERDEKPTAAVSHQSALCLPSQFIKGTAFGTGFARDNDAVLLKRVGTLFRKFPATAVWG